MKDEYDRTFRRLASMGVAIQRQGATIERLLCMATLSLGIGRPDQAFKWAQAAVNDPNCPASAAQEALRLSGYALALKVGILDGHVEGAPPIKNEKGELEEVDKSIPVAELRKRAAKVLEGLEDLTAEETVLLRRLKLGVPVSVVEDLISAKTKLLLKKR